MKLKILVLCTGNSCRSQMAEGFLKSFDDKAEVYSAGVRPEKEVNPYAVEVMREIGIDISNNKPKLVDEFISQSFDYVITVCDNAKESCPVFTGKVKNTFHIPFEDPALAKGSKEEVIGVYRKVRDEIKKEMKLFYQESVID